MRPSTAHPGEGRDPGPVGAGVGAGSQMGANGRYRSVADWTNAPEPVRRRRRCEANMELLAYAAVGLLAISQPSSSGSSPSAADQMQSETWVHVDPETSMLVARLSGEVVKVLRSTSGSGYVLSFHMISIRTTDGLRNVYVMSGIPVTDDLPNVSEYCEVQFSVGAIAGRMRCNGRELRLHY